MSGRSLNLQRCYGDEPDPGHVTLLDSSIRLDVLTDDHVWSSWLQSALADDRDLGSFGAHAAVLANRLLTRDAVRYRTYFPLLKLLAPLSQHSVSRPHSPISCPAGDDLVIEKRP